MRVSLILAGLFLITVTPPTMAADAGRFAKWSKIELVFEGPPSRRTGRPNPFAVLFDVNFTSPRGKLYHVHGFYSGDGKGGLGGKDGSFRNRTNLSGGARRLIAPDSGDWALRIVGEGAQSAGKQDWGVRISKL